MPEEENGVDAMEEKIAQCIGGVGEVQTEDNHVLFVGEIEAYDRQKGEVSIALHRGNETPQGVIYHTPVKMQLHLRRQWGTLVMLYGNVVACAAGYWRVAVRNVVACAEGRRAFRQKVREKGQVAWDGDGARSAPCRLEDISLVGVAFFSEAELEEESRVVLTVPALVKGGASYQLTCRVVVRRAVESAGSRNQWRYGCEFHELDKRTENQLCKDIFALQAQSMNRK